MSAFLGELFAFIVVLLIGAGLGIFLYYKFPTRIEKFILSLKELFKKNRKDDSTDDKS